MRFMDLTTRSDYCL